MAFGMRLWNAAGELRIDTTDRTMRLSQLIHLDARTVPQFTSQQQVVAVDGFDPAVDGAFLVFATSPRTGDQKNIYQDQMPDIIPAAGSITVRWLGNTSGYNHTTYFLACHLVILRKS